MRVRRSLSAVSKPNFARKYALESSRRDLHNALLCTVLESNPKNQENHGGKRTWSNPGKTGQEMLISSRNPLLPPCALWRESTNTKQSADWWFPVELEVRCMWMLMEYEDNTRVSFFLISWYKFPFFWFPEIQNPSIMFQGVCSPFPKLNCLLKIAKELPFFKILLDLSKFR